MNYLHAINPFYATHRVPAAIVPMPEPYKPLYARLPRAPINASPVPHLTSLYHFHRAGEYGDRGYPGNCGGSLIKDLLRYFRPKTVFDPMTGSGTCRDVCQELGIACTSGDIHQGFDPCDPKEFFGDAARFQRRSFDFVWIHPPYWRQKLYCVANSVMWCPPRLPLRRGGTAQSGSHIIIATALCDGTSPKLVAPGRGSGTARCYKIENRQFDGDAGL